MWRILIVSTAMGQPHGRKGSIERMENLTRKITCLAFQQQAKMSLAPDWDKYQKIGSTSSQLNIIRSNFSFQWKWLILLWFDVRWLDWRFNKMTMDIAVASATNYNEMMINSISNKMQRHNYELCIVVGFVSFFLFFFFVNRLYVSVARVWCVFKHFSFRHFNDAQMHRNYKYKIGHFVNRCAHSMHNENNRKLYNSNKQNIRRKWNSTVTDWKLSSSIVSTFRHS